MTLKRIGSKWFLFAIPIVGSGAAMSVMNCESFTKHPGIEIPSVCDFGTVSRNERLQSEFTITNAGASDLIIDGIRSSCSCVLLQLDTPVIKPNCNGLLHVNLNAIGSRGGEYAIPVVIQSNDRSMPTARFSVKYKIAREHPSEPRQLFFGRLSNAELPIGLRLMYFCDREIAQEIISSQHMKCTLDYVQLNYPTHVDERGIGIAVVVRRDAPLGDILGDVLIPSGSTTTKVALFGHVRGNVFATPSTLVMEHGLSESATVFVKSRDGRVFQIKRVSLTKDLEGVTTSYDNSFRVEHKIRFSKVSDLTPSGSDKAVGTAVVSITYSEGGLDQEAQLAIPIIHKPWAVSP